MSRNGMTERENTETVEDGKPALGHPSIVFGYRGNEERQKPAVKRFDAFNNCIATQFT